jgi:hypothetical protein
MLSSRATNAIGDKVLSGRGSAMVATAPGSFGPKIHDRPRLIKLGHCAKLGPIIWLFANAGSQTTTQHSPFTRVVGCYIERRRRHLRSASYAAAAKSTSTFNESSRKKCDGAEEARGCAGNMSTVELRGSKFRHTTRCRAPIGQTSKSSGFKRRPSNFAAYVRHTWWLLLSQTRRFSGKSLPKKGECQ